MRNKNALYRVESWVLIEEFQVAAELLHTIDFAAPLDFDRNDAIVVVSAQQIYGPDVGRVFAANELVALGNVGGIVRQ